MKTIKYGMRHADVITLKKKLDQIGYSDSGIYSGEFAGSSTMYFVMLFQLDRGLVVDGKFGSNSWSALNALTSGTKPTIRGGKTVNLRNQPDTILSEYGTVVSKYIRPKGLNNVEMYGPLPTGRLKVLELPYPMRLAWDTDHFINKISVNPLIHNDLKAALVEVNKVYSKDEIEELGLDLYGGCYNDRNIKGGHSKSTHSWAVSIDINPLGNPYKRRADKTVNGKPLAKRFMDVMLAHNFYTLASDLMHFNWIDSKFIK